MILVDPSTMSPSIQHTPPIPDFLSDSLHRLDEDMQNILQDRSKYVSLRDKVTRYNQVLKKYLHFYEDYKDKKESFLPHRAKPPSSTEDPLPQPTTPKLNNLLTNPQNTKNDHIQQDVIQALPITLRPKAKRILSYLNRIPDLTWTQKGEMKLGEKVFSNSHAVDLVGGVLRQKQNFKPEGIEDFIYLLKENNLPSDLVTHPQPRIAPSPPKRSKATPLKRLRNKNKTNRWMSY